MRMASGALAARGWLVVGFVAILVVAGCSPRGSQETAASQANTAIPVFGADAHQVLPATVTDVSGEQITVTDTSRIVSLNGGISETLVAMGMVGSIVGRDVSSDFPEVATVEVVTNGHDVSPEGVLSLAPTLVLADERTGPPESLETIQNAGVPVVRVPEVWALADLAKRVEAIAAATGQVQAADAINSSIAAELETIETPQDQAAPVVAFLYLRGTAAVYLLGGKGSGGDDIIAAAGGIDAGTKAGLDSFTPLTPEALVNSAPDVILVMSKGLDSVGGKEGLLQLPGVSATPAGRDGRIIAVPDGELLSFGPRTPSTVRELAAQLYSGQSGSGA